MRRIRNDKAGFMVSKKIAKELAQNKGSHELHVKTLERLMLCNNYIYYFSQSSKNNLIDDRQLNKKNFDLFKNKKGALYQEFDKWRTGLDVAVARKGAFNAAHDPIQNLGKKVLETIGRPLITIEAICISGFQHIFVINGIEIILDDEIISRIKRIIFNGRPSDRKDILAKLALSAMNGDQEFDYQIVLTVYGISWRYYIPKSH